jgi:tRNA threonylcarbamoyladenosine biosynthesis protein TsaE
MRSRPQPIQIVSIRLWLQASEVWRYSMQDMSTVLTSEIVSTSSDDTLRLGEAVGKRLKGGECIELTSDLGGGKTVFVRGLAKGAGSDDQVASPTFTLAREYRTDTFAIHHYDLYRLEKAGILGEELAESLADPKAVVAIEWAGIASDLLPSDRLTIEFKITGPEQRILKMSAGPQHTHLLPQSI